MDDRANVEIGGDYESLESSLEESESLFDAFGESVEGIAQRSESAWRAVTDKIAEAARTVSIGWQIVVDHVARGVDDVYANIKRGSQAFVDMTRDISQLNSMIKAMGSVVGFTLRGLEQMNEQFKNLSVHGSDGIRSAQQALLEFKNVRGDIFKEAIKGAMDFSAVVGGPLSSAVSHYGRLLNDPVKGLEDLVDQNVVFSEAQQRLIAQMLKANDVIGLQRIILSKLAELYGGAAKDQANTLWGALQRIDNVFADIWRTVGSLLAPTLANRFVPLLEKVSKVVTYVVKQLDDGGEGMNKVFDRAIVKVKEWGEVALDWGQKVFSVLKTAVQNWDVTWKMIWTGAKILTFETLATVMEYGLKAFEYLKDVATAAWKKISDVMAPMVNAIKAGFALVIDVATAAWDLILEGAQWAWENIGKVVVDWALVAIGAGFLAYHFFKWFFDTVWSIAKNFFAGLAVIYKPVFEGLITVVSGVAKLWGFALGGMWMTFKGFLQSVSWAITGEAEAFTGGFGVMFDAAVGAVTGMANLFKGMFTGVGAGADTLFGKIFKYLKKLGFVLLDNVAIDIKNAMRPAFDAMNKAKDAWADAKAKAGAAADDIKKKFADAFKDFNAKGIEDGIKKLRIDAKAMGGDFDKAFDAFKDKFFGNNAMDKASLFNLKKKLKEIIDSEKDPEKMFTNKGFFGDIFPDDDKDKKTRSGSIFEGLHDLRRRIEDAAASSPEADATKQQSKLLERMHEEAKRQRERLIKATTAKQDKKLANPKVTGFDLRIFDDGRGMAGMGF